MPAPRREPQGLALALAAARAGDYARTGEITGWIADQGSVSNLAAVCRAVAETALQALLALYWPPDAGRGEAWVLDRLGNAAGHPPRLFAARLLTAYANRDEPMVTALVAAAAGASRNERAESLRSLVIYAVGLDARAARKNGTNR